ncbi:hypothetical protein ACRTC3_19530 [Photobacterium damselae]|uniref:hypothetical protein n=1 Tax=Photobacterium damselae TaxID=38293 RepID=UPI003D7E9750
MNKGKIVSLNSFIYFLFLLTVAFYSFKNLNGLLPLNLSHLILLMLLPFCICIFLTKAKVERLFVTINLFVLFFVIVSIFYGFNEVNDYINIFIFIFVSYVVVSNQEQSKLIKWYLKLVFILVFMGYVQFLSSFITPEWFYSFSFLGKGNVNITFSSGLLRVFSLSSEPASFAGMLLPAIGLSIARLANTVNIDKYLSKKFALCILIIVVLTFSSVAYFYLISFFLFFIFLSGQVSKFFKSFLFCFMLLVFAGMTQVHSVQERYDSVIHAYEDKGDSKINNLSTFAIYSNILVAEKVLKNYPCLGRGLFSHEHSYNEYIYDVFPVSFVRMELNKKDASSLYIRLLSEAGFLGFISVMVFFFLFFLNGMKTGKSIISSVFLLSVVLIGVRSGTYNYSLIWFYLFTANYFRKCEL